jgi:hypothetical protein
VLRLILTGGSSIAAPFSRHRSRSDYQFAMDRLSAGVTFFPAQCSAALNQRETVASGRTREKSRIEFLIILSAG